MPGKLTSGNFLLTNLLLDKMKATAEATGIQGRIINISSSDHATVDGSWLDLDTINDQSKYIIKHPLALSLPIASFLFLLLTYVGFCPLICSGRYQGLRAYGRSKLANILHANELSRRLQVGKPIQSP